MYSQICLFSYKMHENGSLSNKINEKSVSKSERQMLTINQKRKGGLGTSPDVSLPINLCQPGLSIYIPTCIVVI